MLRRQYTVSVYLFLKVLPETSLIYIYVYVRGIKVPTYNEFFLKKKRQSI